MFAMGELWTQVGSSFATMMFIYTMYQNYFPPQIRMFIIRYTRKITTYFNPYIEITFHEFEPEHVWWYKRSKAYSAIERYLAAHSSSQAKRLKAKVVNDSEAVVLSMDDHEEVTDEYKDGSIKLWWTSSQQIAEKRSITLFPSDDDGKRYFKLSFHKKYRDVIANYYLKHVLDEGKAISVRERQRKLYTNNKSDGNGGGYRSNSRLWNHVVFEHPATFHHLAMEPKRKQEIIDDLVRFSTSKAYYAKIGKVWKRGYLLYGPPGTGKSTMIAAMANFLKYDVYDLELTSVKDNTELRKLLIDTSSKSIVVIEDIDCSVDLTGQREKKKETKTDEEKKDGPVEKEIKKGKEEEKKGSQVTLSGLLNCIDGLWSTCGEERIFIFTTNYVKKLDPALIRRGRMDKHIELSYCCFESFKLLARNYLDVESHEVLFPKISQLLEETDMTPADVAENLMPKAADDDADACLEKLIKALEEAKEEAIKLKKAAEEDERVKKAEKEIEKKKSDNDESVKENGDVNDVAE